jgi:hypothetical protein
MPEWPTPAPHEHPFNDVGMPECPELLTCSSMRPENDGARWAAASIRQFLEPNRSEAPEEAVRKERVRPVMELTPAAKKQIYVPAVRLFYERGYHATTMRGISANVGVKPPSINNHYRSGQEILHQIAQGIVVSLPRGAREAASRCADPAAGLRTFVM